MKLRKVTSVCLIAGLCFSAITGLAAGTQFADPSAIISIGGATGTEAAGRVRVDATAGASIMITPDQNYGPLSYPERDGRRVPDNLKPDSPATARVVIRGERTDFGLNTNTSKNGTAVGAGAKAKGNYAAAFGNKAAVKAEDGLSLGHGASVTADNSVALGAGSIADTVNTVSVGSDKGVRKITHVADGTVAFGSNDVVTGNQLYALTQQVAELRKENETLRQALEVLKNGK